MPLLTFIARVQDGLLLVASLEYNSEGANSMDVYKSQAKRILKTLDVRSSAKCSIESGPYSFHYMIDTSSGTCFLTLTDRGYPKRLIYGYLDELHALFLEELRRDHGDNWRSTLETVARPYAFIKFERTIQRKRKEYMNPQSRGNRYVRRRRWPLRRRGTAAAVHRRRGALRSPPWPRRPAVAVVAAPPRRRRRPRRQHRPLPLPPPPSAKLTGELSDIHNIMKKNINEVLNRGEKLDHVAAVTTKLRADAKNYKWGTKRLSTIIMLQQYGPPIAVGFFVLAVIYLRFFW